MRLNNKGLNKVERNSTNDKNENDRLNVIDKC